MSFCRGLLHLLLLALPVAVVAQTIPTDLIPRVFLLKHGSQTGSGFAMEVGDRQYLVTAKHLVKGISHKTRVQIYQPPEWKDLDVTVINCENVEVDIVVLAPPVQISPTFPLEPTTDGLVVGQGVYFLGFPFAETYSPDINPNNFLLFPFVKRAIVSAFDYANNDRKILYLDGQNNHGFSGGPVVFQDSNTQKFKVAGVIGSYEDQKDKIAFKGIRTELVLPSSSGIILAHTIDSAVRAIEKKPIGPVVRK